MLKRLLIITFVLALAADSASTVASQLSGERCVMSCCKTAQRADRDLTPARLRCLVDCGQPTSTSPSPVSALAAPSQKRITAVEWQPTEPRLISYIQHIRFPNSPTQFIAGNSSRYLATGTLLI